MVVELDISPRTATLITKEEIVGVRLKYMEVVLNISTTIYCSMLEKHLMALVEVDLGLVPAFIPPIIQLIVVDHLFFIVVLITEVFICLTQANFLHITMVE